MENEYDKRIDEIITELEEITKGANRSFILITGEGSSIGNIKSRIAFKGNRFLLGTTINGFFSEESNRDILEAASAIADKFDVEVKDVALLNN